MYDPYAEFEQATLPNGLTVYAAHWPGRPWEVVEFVVHSGADQDPQDLPGVAHFVEHLISNNAPASNEELRAFFEERGGNVNFGLTGYRSSSYGFRAPADKETISRALAYFGHALLTATLIKEIEAQRVIIAREFETAFKTDFVAAHARRIHEVLHAGTPREHHYTPLGSKDTIPRIARGDLQRFYDAHYTPTNMSVVCVGGITLSEIMRLLLASPFSIEKPGSRTPVPACLACDAPPVETRYVFELSKHVATPHAPRTFNFASYARLPGNINPQLISILCSMLSHIVFDEVRGKRGWAYSAGSSWTDHQSHRTLEIECEAVPLDALAEIDGVIEAVVDAVGHDSVRFDHKKASYGARLRMADVSGSSLCKAATTTISKLHRIETVTQALDELQGITMADVRNLLPYLAPERRFTVITRP